MVETERQRLGKVSVKSTELRRRAVLNEYRVQSNRLKEEKKKKRKEEKKLLHFYPKEGFYTPNIYTIFFKLKNGLLVFLVVPP